MFGQFARTGLVVLMPIAVAVGVLASSGGPSHAQDVGEDLEARLLASGSGLAAAHAPDDLLRGRVLEINDTVPVVPAGIRPSANRSSFDTMDEVLESQDFEGTEFPPTGWRTFDDLAPEGVDPNFIWAMEDIEVPRDGGVQAAWSIGGGTIGGTLGFGGVYADPVASVLAYGPMDLTAFPDGLTVQHQFYPDLPVRTGEPNNAAEAKAFLVCTDRRDSTTNLDCRTLASEDGPRKQWVGWGEPLEFALAGGLDEVFVYFIHRDLTPEGTHMGVIIDNVEIVGKTISDPGPGPSPVPTASSTPQPGPGPGPGPAPDPNRAFLPFVFNNFDKANLPSEFPTPQTGSISVDFGTDINRETGALANEGTRFTNGIQQLCAREQWRDMVVGTPMRVQWFVERGGVFEELDPGNVTGVNDTFDAPAEASFAFQCVGFVDASGNAIPVPNGRYRTSIYLRGSDVAAASRTAEIVPGSPGPTATPGANPPTASPTPPGEATPKPTLPANCTNPLVNGDFEQGPNVGWQQQSANNQASIRADGALQSNFGVIFGLYPGAQEAVMALEPVTTLPEGELESATVRWWLNVVSQEDRSNGDNADRFGIGTRGNTNDDGRSLVAVSEDSFAPNTTTPFPSDRWWPLQADITSGFVQGEGFDEAHLLLVGILNANELLTNFRVDNVVLELCTPEGMHVVPMRAVAPNAADLATVRGWDRDDFDPSRSAPVEIVGRPTSMQGSPRIERLAPEALLPMGRTR